MSRGHSDRLPLVALAADPADPCSGTGNPGCTDPSSADFDQRRVHHLENGVVIWDFAGNVWEGTSGSMGGPSGLWMSYDHAAFLTGERAAEFHAAFAPSGPYTHAHGMGRIYGGSSQLVRGGAFNGYSSGAAGSRGPHDVGIYAAFHNKSSFGSADGFRCVYAP
ncbi:MAG: hypothetical protein M3Y87_28140 [Myxococcota bacterium]|nr:hypothetical protein [Myxococcota bacterium]